MEVEGNWQWITKEPFSYRDPAIFDNLNNEDYLMAWRFQPNGPLIWNDVESGRSLSNRAVVEFEAVTAVPEPASLLLGLISIGSLCSGQVMKLICSWFSKAIRLKFC